MTDPRIAAIPDVHGHAKGEHKPYAEERPIPYSARMLFLWFYHAALRGQPRFMMVADHINYLTFEDPAAVNLVRRALKLAAAGDLYGAAETAGVDLPHAAVVSEGLRRGMRYSIGAEVDNDPRARPDAQNIVDAMKPDGLIRSVHFLAIEHPVHGAGWQWPFDNPDFASLYDAVGAERVWELYVSTLVEAIEKQPGHVVGHFYAPARFGHWPDDKTLGEYEDRVVAACRDRGMALEVSTRFMYRYIEDEAQSKRYFDANLRLMRKAKADGVGIALGSDAHSPKDQGVGFDRALEMLDEADVNELVFPIGGRLARVALRATKEHLARVGVLPPAPEPAASPEPVPAAVGSRDGEAQAGSAVAEAATGGQAPGDAARARRAAARRASRATKAAVAAATETTPQAPAAKPRRASRPEHVAAVEIAAKPARPAKQPKPAAKAAKPPAAKAASAKKPALVRKAAPRGKKVGAARPAAKKAAASRAPKRAAKTSRPAKRARPARSAKPAARAAVKATARTRKRTAAKPPARKTTVKKAQPKKKQTKSRR